MKSFVPEDPHLQAVVEKVLTRRRLDREDGLALYRTHDLLSLGRLANYVCEQRHGNRAYCRAELPSAKLQDGRAGTEARPGPGSLASWPRSGARPYEPLDALLEIRSRQDQSPNLSLYEAPAIPEATGFADLKNIAVARLLLDNVPHICARLTPALSRVSQVALRFGADTIAGPDLAELERLARDAGREPHLIADCGL